MPTQCFLRVSFIKHYKCYITKPTKYKLTDSRPVFTRIYFSTSTTRRIYGTRDISRSNTLQWRHHGRFGVSNHRRIDCLLNSLFGRRSKKTSKFRVTGHYEGNPPGTGAFLHKGSVTRQVFQFDDGIISQVRVDMDVSDDMPQRWSA